VEYLPSRDVHGLVEMLELDVQSPWSATDQLGDQPAAVQLHLSTYLLTTHPISTLKSQVNAPLSTACQPFFGSFGALCGRLRRCLLARCSLVSGLRRAWLP
jgi:hypothetical protein